MKTTNKIGLIAFASLLAFSLASCGSGNKDNQDGAQEEQEQIETIEHEIESMDSINADIEKTSEELEDLLNDLD